MPPRPLNEAVLRETRAWVDRAVIGLNLCPFAKAVQAKGQVRYAVEPGEDPLAVLQALEAELCLLRDADAQRLDTTLLILPNALAAFDDFNDFLDVADQALHTLRLEGVLQIASFHPHYRFAGTDAHDLGNATNRSPFPCLHLLREDSVDRAVATLVRPQAIVEANLRSLQALGRQGWDELRAACRRDAQGED